MRILIVEDEVRLAEALAQIMAEQKYQVDQVHNGADGLDYALTAQYDVIVLDVMLPKLDGWRWPAASAPPTCPLPSSCSPPVTRSPTK